MEASFYSYSSLYSDGILRMLDVNVNVQPLLTI